ncbi:trans-sulfuration enzyme family protein [Megasphaera stantonii]|uniref:homocysteine desulfhydrase n=1 Tax=Megasphaera stantonii TaxID=2144175 RepID=A0A346B0T0_9FIRM|nr:aminotransferase class I/II-fold pyridoxal phosphate-dependent enzyme [Megasphaera stantonii]AXL21723.1 aminotransferase class V-fold PLP-dependent enzyme [Megasphaera stantonii]
MERNMNRGTEIIMQGAEVKGTLSTPEVLPIYLTTAFRGGADLDELNEYYAVKGYTYNRIRNPNRNALTELVSYLEGGEASMICSSGMGAITTTLLSLADAGDHILANSNLYGETLEILDVIKRYGIESTCVDFTDIEAVRKAVQANTKIVYTEVISNPTMAVVDVEAVARIAHDCGAKLVVDNTFTTSTVIKPIDFGADVTINSLTKFMNGHSDIVGGSATASKDIVDKACKLQALLGCTLDPFSSYLCERSLRTLDLRMERQLKNAEALAKALDEHPCVLKVNHPSLPTHPQHDIAKRLFAKGYGAMLSFEMPEDREKINAFMRRLHIAKYAMTLGGYATTLSYPILSSHASVPRDIRLKMGITDGLMRVSVGLEDVQDLIADFTQALSVFEK